MAQIVQLYKDKAKTQPIYPYVKGESIVLNNKNQVFPSLNIGAANQPIYLKDGVFTACDKRKTYMCNVYYSGNGDTQFTGKVPFNHVRWNPHNCYDTNSGYFTAPESGVYYASFTYYSNSTAREQRPAIMVNDKLIIMSGTLNTGGGRSISTILLLNKGDKVSAGGYATDFPINIYSAAQHNEFCVCYIGEI